MAGTPGLLTLNNKLLLEVDAVPSASSGTTSDPGSIAFFDDGLGGGTGYIKTGALDTDWDKIVTETSGTNVATGSFLRLPIYDTDPTAPHLADTVVQNSQNIHVVIVAQPSRSADIDYTIPNPGDGVTAASFVLTEGAQTINGNKTFGNDVVVSGNFTVNGTLTFVNSTNLTVSDPLITLNKGGAAASGAGVGFEIEENSLITGYLKTTADRNGYIFRAPNNANPWTIDFSNLTGTRVVKAPDSGGTMVVRPNATVQVAGQVAFFSDANNITSETNLFWDASNHRLGIGNAAPSVSLHVTGSARITSLNANQPVRSDTNGVLSNSLISLTGDVSGILPTANGGTGTGTTFTLGSVVYAGASGIYTQDNANFFWDGSTHRLGLGNAAPARQLDVTGSSVFHGAMLLNDATATKAKRETLQTYVATTDATVTTLATVITPSDSVTLIVARITARRTGGTAGATDDSATYTRTACIKNIAGTASILNGVQTDHTAEDQKLWDGTIDVTGASARVRITGAVNNNVDWTCTYETYSLS